MTHQNLYDVLDIPRDASIEQINQAFRDKALRLHPDKNKTDPEAAMKFKRLTQAYEVLRDPMRRQKYDATLPVPPAAPVRVTDVVELWRTAGERFFEQSERFTPAVDALRLSHPLVLEDESLLVVGIAPDKTRLIGYISAAIHNQIRRIISELYGKPLDFRIISGTTLEEWQSLKHAEEKIRQRKFIGMPANGNAPEPAPAAMPVTVDDWEELLDALSRQWAACTARSFPQSRARFVLEQLPLISRAEDRSRAVNAVEDGLQRNLARALDRLANLTGIESGVIALEYLRYRARITGGM